MTEFDKIGYLKIGNEADRATVATILFKNGYSVYPVRWKKNGKTYEYFVKYERLPYNLDEQEANKLG